MTAPLDLRALGCPFTWVRTRIALERLGVGDRLEVWLAAGEPAESVPRSASEEGHGVVGLEPLPGGAVRLTLEKRAPLRAGVEVP